MPLAELWRLTKLVPLACTVLLLSVRALAVDSGGLNDSADNSSRSLLQESGQASGTSQPYTYSSSDFVLLNG